jgi:hypothetical protein
MHLTPQTFSTLAQKTSDVGALSRIPQTALMEPAIKTFLQAHMPPPYQAFGEWLNWLVLSRA